MVGPDKSVIPGQRLFRACQFFSAGNMHTCICVHIAVLHGCCNYYVGSIIVISVLYIGMYNAHVHVHVHMYMYVTYKTHSYKPVA